MVFNSLTFVVFFAVVLLAHNLSLSWRTKKIQLLAASYIFYGAWNPPFAGLLFFSTLADYWAANWICRCRRQAVRVLLLASSVSISLGLLGFFKYGGFLLENFKVLAGALGWEYVPPAWSIVLPVGISFYTFQTMSYVIDVYRREGQLYESFLDFALFVSFFPQLVAGPIIRSEDFRPQCAASARVSGERFSWGLVLLLLGLAEKAVLADSLFAPISDCVFNGWRQAGMLEAWTGTLAFSAQIYFDFAGYSTCAIGIALCLGFTFRENFRYPYAAIGFSDFWRRWHVSLSTWLRDYLYIPMGGNRRGPWRAYVNLMAVMLLGGLWHGASWRFVAWGGLHALFLALERLLSRFFSAAPWHGGRPARLAGAAVTYLGVCLAWVFFRAQDFGSAGTLLARMLFGGTGTLYLTRREMTGVACASIAIMAAHWLCRDRDLEDLWRAAPWWGRSGVLAVLMAALLIFTGEQRAFIYFQF